MNAEVKTSEAELARLLARQEAANVLWREGHVEECYGLVRSLVLDLLDRAGTAERLAAHRSDLDVLARSSTPATPSPLGVEHVDWLERARLVLARIGERTPQAAALRRRRMRAFFAVLVVVCGLVGWLVYRAETNVSARASGQFAADTNAALAIDGLERTEWLLPNDRPGWLELELTRSRVLRAVVIKNARNRHYLDRAAREVRIEAFDRKKRVFEGTVEFKRIEENPAAVRVELPGVKVSRVRLEVKSYFSRGGGLAEVTLE